MTSKAAAPEAASFGHLLGNGEYQMVMAQCQKRVNQMLTEQSAVPTAFDLDGNILYIGTISADMPMQIYDIDGDGFDEVITAKNFEVLILDGRTGEVKKRAKAPFSTPERTELLSVFLIKSTHLTELILMVCVYVISVVLTSHAIFSLRTVIAEYMHLTMTLRLCGISRVIRIPDIFLLQLILTEMDMMNF